MEARSKASVDVTSPRVFTGGIRRVVIEGVRPEIDCGRFAIKRVAGERVVVEADIFADGHDLISCVLKYRSEADSGWREVPLTPVVNDRWRAGFLVTEIGAYRYTLEGWIDPFRSWRRDLEKRRAAGQDIASEILVGAGLVEDAARRASAEDSATLTEMAKRLRGAEPGAALDLIDEKLAAAMQRYPDRAAATLYDKELRVVVDDVRARFGAWYEMFPRSCASPPGAHGTFRDCEEKISYVAEMGFDVLYLPPIHPIGRTDRKGRNNAPATGPDEPGSPWAIGSPEGGHKAIHPELGSLDDFKRLIRKARDYGIEIALDIAFQCTPDHPYVREHPEWFRHRPDGTIQYAENPPKQYQDIYPLNFETPDWRNLWQELKSVVLFWLAHGVRIFRVDNPHTKPFPFWEWLIEEVKKQDPAVIFLSEAFTRPKVMYRLAKSGFTQSYTYFAWRNTKWEITEYFTELTQTEVREYFRSNLWPNTPDILTEYLQFGGRPAFMARFVLAATLGANYGIYGPAFELAEDRPREPGSEEYLDSEKYEIRTWNLDAPESLGHLIARVNRIRRENPALQSDWSLRFHPTDNDQIICYSKRTEDFKNVIVTVVNLDPHHTQSGWVELSLKDLQIEPQQPYQMHDLLTHARYIWQGSRNYVELSPQSVPAHIFQVLRRTHKEQDFDYFM
ncbi:MAG: alpha-1,4-glucan--maltose-1-phosphate maltosyltransferase [Candidatus Binatia bacterium]